MKFCNLTIFDESTGLESAGSNLPSLTKVCIQLKKEEERERQRRRERKGERERGEG